MKWATVGLLLLGVIGAVAASVLVAVLSAGPGSDDDPMMREVETLVAAMRLPDMTMLDAGALTTRAIPLRERPKGAFSDATPAIGKVLRVGVAEGQIITKDLFVTDGTGPLLATTLPPGYRAVTLALDQSGGMENLLYPGSVVDVLASFRIGESAARRESIAVTLLERVSVLAVEHQTVVSGEGDPPRSAAGRAGRRLVTLRVTPQQASQLQLALEHGSITLAMRNPTDFIAQEPNRMLLSSLSHQNQQWMIDPPDPPQREVVLTPAGSEADGPLPAADSDAQPLQEPAATDHQKREPQTWQVVVIRGNTQEVCSLPLDLVEPDMAIAE
jgi:pilus assembly protein CpaB